RRCGFGCRGWLAGLTFGWLRYFRLPAGLHGAWGGRPGGGRSRFGLAGVWRLRPLLHLPFGLLGFCLRPLILGLLPALVRLGLMAGTRQFRQNGLKIRGERR